MRVDVDRGAQAVARGERFDRGHQAAVGEQRRHDAAREVAQLGDRVVRLALGVEDQAADLRLVVDAQLRAPELQRQRHQPRLRAVVQVALDPPQLRRLRVDRLAARARQQVDPRAQRAPPAGDEHAVVQRDQRVRAAGGRQRRAAPTPARTCARPRAATSAAT